MTTWGTLGQDLRSFCSAITSQLFKLFMWKQVLGTIHMYVRSNCGYSILRSDNAETYIKRYLIGLYDWLKEQDLIKVSKSS